MKAKMNRIIGTAALVAVLLAPAAMAQEKGSAKGGASRLLPPVAVSPGRPAAAMNCAACTDTLVTVPNREARGGGARDLISKSEVPVAKHLCASCATTFEVVGHGKGKRDVAVHVCADCLAKGKAPPTAPAKAAGAPTAEVTKVAGNSCCLPKYSLKHLCPECAQITAR